jgi:GNAT superfamily N-acetyltransferase
MQSPAPAGLVVVHACSDVELAQLAAVRRAVDPDANPLLASLRHRLDNFTGVVFLLAYLAGEPVGCGYAEPFTANDREESITADMSVIPASRGRGIGSALYGAASAHARSLGKTGLTVESKEDDEASLAWLERRGFVEVERQKAVALELANAVPASGEVPPGIRIVTEAGNGRYEPGMYEVAIEAMRDIPGLDGEHSPTYDQWRATEVQRPSRRKDLSFVALAGDEVIGYASLHVFGDPTVAHNSLTVVSRPWRNRGIATALKRAQIEAARRAGIVRMLTESEERNVPMRQLNEKLGYRPAPGKVVLQGPLAPGDSQAS